MRNLLYIAALLLTVSCTKEILVEVPVQNPVNTQLQSQITQLQNTISNLTSTNNNLESQIRLLQSEADLLAIDLENVTDNAEDLMDRLLALEEHIEEYNIEIERAQQESFFRLNYSQTLGYNVFRAEGLRLVNIVRYDTENSVDIAWWEAEYGLPDGKEVAFSTTGVWDENVDELRSWYNSDGDLVRILLRVNGNIRPFYTEAYDYIYQFEDEVNEFITTNNN